MLSNSSTLRKEWERRPLGSGALECGDLSLFMVSQRQLPHPQRGISSGRRKAYIRTIAPTTAARKMLCLKTALKIAASFPACCVAVLETTIDWASIILPITPPHELAAHMRTALR